MSCREFTTRVVIIGNTETGKTSLFNRYFNSTFSLNTRSTIGANVYTRLVSEDYMKLFINYYDTAGQERYRSLGQVYYRNSIAAILVFDITERRSFEDIESWVNEYSMYSNNRLIFLAANKWDLQEEATVTVSEVCDLAMKLECGYVYTSAADGSGVTELFDMVNKAVAKIVSDNYVNIAATTERRLDLESRKSSSNCC